MPRKENNVGQRAEAVARAAIRRNMRSLQDPTGEPDSGKQLLLFAAVRRAWAEGYRTALKEVRKSYYTYDENEEGTLRVEHPRRLDEFLNDTNRLK